MNIETIKSVYFVGAGGIGMSALVRYFLFKGKIVAGYDRTPTPLTETLIAEGAQIHYEENVDLIPEACKDKESTLVIYTPAVPQEHEEIVYFRNNGFEIQKRAQVLGTITHSSKGLCVAGTHGKTTTSTMTAHLFHQSHVECTAFLGGISKNYGTNLLLSQTSPYTVIEADEFDRSFHLAVALYDRNYVYRPRSFGHLRNRASLPGKFRTLYHANPTGWRTDYPQRHLPATQSAAGCSCLYLLT